MLKVYTKNGIELIDDSSNVQFHNYEINLDKNLIIDTNNNLAYSINGEFFGRVLGSESPVPYNDRVLRFTVDPSLDATVKFYIATHHEFTVDWGDSTTDTFPANPDSIGIYTPEHTYTSTSATRQVNVMFRSRLEDCNLFYFVNANGVTSIDSPLPHVSNATGLINVCKNMANLTSIPENLFVHNPHITSVSSCFYGCTSLTTVPDNLLHYVTRITSCNAMFKNSGLSKIPNGFFDTLRNINTFQETFSGCINLTSVPENLFRMVSVAKVFTMTFAYCDALVPNKNIFCDEDTEKDLRFTGHVASSLRFSQMFYRTAYTGSGAGEVPRLWEYAVAKSANSANIRNYCGGTGNNANSISNYSEVPRNWGGVA